MKVKQKIEFALDEIGDSLKVLLADGEEIILDYEREQIKPVRVRVPLPNKEKVIKNAEYWVEQNDRWTSVEEWVNFYAKCRENDIYEQIQEIRKCLKRIKQHALGSRISKGALKEYLKNKK